MFIGNYPKFNEGRILKSGMLESLRDYPREIMKIKYPLENVEAMDKDLCKKYQKDIFGY